MLNLNKYTFFIRNPSNDINIVSVENKLKYDETD